MTPRRYRSSRSNRYAGFRDATSIEECVQASRAINRRVKADRLTASAAEREKYLRNLMGLPPVRCLSDNEART